MTNELIDLLARRRGKSEAADIAASEFGKRGKRVLYVTSDAKAAKERLLKRNNGAWPIGLKVKQI